MLDEEADFVDGVLIKRSELKIIKQKIKCKNNSLKPCITAAKNTMI